MNTIQLLASWNGLALFVVVFADQVGLPVPCPPCVLAAGALAAGGKMNPASAVGMTAAGAVLADLFWFCLGRKSSGRALELLSRWSFSRNFSIAYSRSVFARHGLFALTAAKFFPGTVVPSLAGALGMSVFRFLVFDGLAALFYGGCYVALGYLFHNRIQQVMVWFDRVGHGVIGLGAVLVVGYLAYKYALRRRTRNSQKLPSHIPEKKAVLNAKSTRLAEEFVN